MPDLVGKTVLKASELLTQAGLTAKASYVDSSGDEKDIIVSQDVEPGTQVKKGSEIKQRIRSCINNTR